MAVFEFWYRNVQIWQTRSPNNDTNYASFVVKVGDTQYGPVVQSCGDMHKTGDWRNGIWPVGPKIQADIPNDETLVAIGWTLVNSSNGNDALSNKIGNAAVQIASDAAAAIPVVGPAISVIANLALDGIFRNHDGVCELGNQTYTGAQINALPSGQNLSFTHKTYGASLNDPTPDSGDYTSTFYIYRPGEYAGGDFVPAEPVRTTPRGLGSGGAGDRN